MTAPRLQPQQKQKDNVMSRKEELQLQPAVHHLALSTRERTQTEDHRHGSAYLAPSVVSSARSVRLNIAFVPYKGI